nr:hypothetical protein [Tanacetum cinerariifolium]
MRSRRNNGANTRGRNNSQQADDVIKIGSNQANNAQGNARKRVGGKSGEPIVETLKELGESSVDVYDPPSEQIKNLEIYGEKGLFFMGSYKESLLLLDHSDSRLYYYNN